MEQSHLDAAVSISDLFRPLAAAVARTREMPGILNDGGETASGVNWAFLGGFPRSLPAENTLSVAGLPNVIKILDDVEKGRLRRYSFIECHACLEGCVGGCLTVENPYVARGKAIRLAHQLPAGPAIDRQEVERRYREGSFLMDEPIGSRPLRPLDVDISRAIAKMSERDRVCSDLPGIDCGACGAPSCRAFAEDTVQGEAELESCLFYWRREVSERLEALARMVPHRDSAEGDHS